MITHLNFDLKGRSNSTLKIENLDGKNLIITGGNGCGKTRFVEHLYDRLKQELIEKTVPDFDELNYQVFQESELRSKDPEYDNVPPDMPTILDDLSRQLRELKTQQVSYFDRDEALHAFDSSKAILRYYGAYRRADIAFEGSVTALNSIKESGKLDGAHSDSGSKFEQFLISYYNYRFHFMEREQDVEKKKSIESWFIKIEIDLQYLFEDDGLKLHYSAEDMYFYMTQVGKEPFRFRDLSSGYESILSIYADLIMKIEINEVKADELTGIVIIDEIDAHLHVSLQRKILSFLANAFKNIQFIVTTHSPFVIQSIKDSVVYDLSSHEQLEDLSVYSYQSILEGLLGVTVNSLSTEELLDDLDDALFFGEFDSKKIESLITTIKEKEKNLSTEAKLLLRKAQKTLDNNDLKGSKNV
ncbi:AAA family ATPase [Vibrio coralliirubri]|uniref:AAA family ATPase n=1 Tax=Vibrio coralliirubri TaxID=1516159 RepID=UPI000B34ED04|nr:AAA family ATPase [Vibrio coralliirubri]